MNKYKKYLINNIKGGRPNYFDFVLDDVDNNPYPLYVLPYKNCENSNIDNCYRNKNIKESVEFWNSKIAVRFIDPPMINLRQYDPNRILYKLKKNIQILINMANRQSYNNPRPDLPSKEWIWLKIKKITKILNTNMLPNMPQEWCKNKDKLEKAIEKNKVFNLEWLSNEDIDNVLYNMENKYKKFKYLGTVPIDWQKTDYDKCIIHKFTRKNISWVKNDDNNNFCTFDLNDRSLKNKNIFAMVLNTDEHNKGGQHWFSMYIKLNESKTSGTLFLYDSASSSQDTGGNYIKQLVKSIQKKYNLTVYRNKVKSQIKSNSECGMYSMYFILSMLEGDNCNNDNSCIDKNIKDDSGSLYIWNTYFNKSDNKVPDTLVANYRDIFFNNRCNTFYPDDLETYVG